MYLGSRCPRSGQLSRSPLAALVAMPWPHVAWWFKASAVFTELRTWLVLTWRPKHREVFKIFRDLLKRALGARDLRILHLSLLELKKSLEEQNPNLQEPVQEGHFNHAAALELYLSRLTSNLEGEGGYDRHRVELLFESCCYALGLVEEALDQAGGVVWVSGVRRIQSRAGSHKMSQDVTIFTIGHALRFHWFKLKLDILQSMVWLTCQLRPWTSATFQATSRESTMESTSYGSGHPLTGYSLQDTVGHSGHASKIIPFLRECPRRSWIEVDRGIKIIINRKLKG